MQIAYQIAHASESSIKYVRIGKILTEIQMFLIANTSIEFLRIVVFLSLTRYICWFLLCMFTDSVEMYRKLCTACLLSLCLFRKQWDKQKAFHEQYPDEQLLNRYQLIKWTLSFFLWEAQRAHLRIHYLGRLLIFIWPKSYHRLTVNTIHEFIHIYNNSVSFKRPA